MVHDLAHHHIVLAQLLCALILLTAFTEHNELVLLHYWQSHMLQLTVGHSLHDVCKQRGDCSAVHQP